MQLVLKSTLSNDFSPSYITLCANNTVCELSSKIAPTSEDRLMV